ncbi:MAG: hypothetical protein WCD37_12120 [Chloroflexia bacterium]
MSEDKPPAKPEQPTQTAQAYQPAPANQPTSSPQPTSNPPRFLSAVPNWLASWLAILTSIVSLAVATSSFIAATEDPDVSMVLPRLVRMVQGGEAPILYVQPQFISTGRNDKLDVITGISIRVEPVGGGAGADFTWDEQGAWSYDPTAKELTYIFVADAGPLMVSPSNPQFPVGLFAGPPAWQFEPGDYRLTITATRAVGSTPLQGAIVVPFPEYLITFINNSEGTRFAEFPVKP